MNGNVKGAPIEQEAKGVDKKGSVLKGNKVSKQNERLTEYY